jgi:hypothetical protein
MCEETIAKPDGRVMAHQPALDELLAGEEAGTDAGRWRQARGNRSRYSIPQPTRSSPRSRIPPRSPR